MNLQNFLKLTTQAKINLILDVIAKRKDGYHEVEMIMQSIDLGDRLYFKRIKEGIELETENKEIPTDADNLIYKAAKLLFAEYNLSGGIWVKIDKKIPVAAGLAGGSSNAAATLLAINELWNLELSGEKLKSLGAKLGADVPFCFDGGTVLATGIGTELEALKVETDLDIVLVKPPFAVSTAEIYQELDLSQIKEHPDLKRMKKSLESGDKSRIISAIDNLLAKVTMGNYKELKELEELILDAGARRVLMSGSGPTMLAFVMNESAAEGLTIKLKEQLPSSYVIQRTRTTSRGVIIE
jgi:4-diphosphocytidyl-2-C-methyl-D-erythritol kinase